VRASHHASGSASSNSTAVVALASFSVSQMAFQSSPPRGIVAFQ